MKILNCKKKITKEIKNYNQKNKSGKGGKYYPVFFSKINVLCEKYFRNNFEDIYVIFSCCGYISGLDIELSDKIISIRG